MEFAQIYLQIAIVLVAVVTSGGIGYWLSRRHYRDELAYQARVMETEIGRLKRQASVATSEARRMAQDLERTKRKARLARG